MLARVLAGFVDCADIAVVQRRRGSSFLHQARVGCPVRSGFRAKDLDRDQPVERRVFGQINLAHAPGAELSQDAISTDGGWLHAAVEGDYDSIAGYGIRPLRSEQRVDADRLSFGWLSSRRHDKPSGSSEETRPLPSPSFCRRHWALARRLRSSA